MCGRIRLTVPFAERAGGRAQPCAALEFGTNRSDSDRSVRPDGKRRLDLVRWGLIPRWAHSPSVGTKMFNARIETLATKPAFRDALPHRRCLVLANAFYEWKREGKRKVPHAVRSADGVPLAMAGL